MDLPEDCFLAYDVNQEAWYYEANRAAGAMHAGPSLNISASATERGGVAWELTVTEHALSGSAVKLAMFQDSFPAFTSVPEFFTALAEQEPTTVAEVREILDGLGAKDTTARTSPRWRDPRAPLVAKLEEAQAALDRWDVEHAAADPSGGTP